MTKDGSAADDLILADVLAAFLGTCGKVVGKNSAFAIREEMLVTLW